MTAPSSMKSDVHGSDSARATRPAESRFRIDAPNSQPRSFRVIALDAFSLRVVETACAQGAAHLAYAQFDAIGDLAEWIDGADVVAIVARAGSDPAPAARIAELCRPRGVMVTGLVIEPLDHPEPAGRATIVGLRPHCSMLVIAADADYVAEMLDALGPPPTRFARPPGGGTGGPAEPDPLCPGSAIAVSSVG